MDADDALDRVTHESRPITPKEVQRLKNESIPPFVIESFNASIIAGWSAGGRSSSFTREAVIQRIVTAWRLAERCRETTEELVAKIFTNGYLDVEPLFEAAGWKVEYHTSAIGENSFAPFFRFTPRDEEISHVR